MKRIVKHELIEVLIPAGSQATRFMIPDQQNLRNTQIWGIQFYFDKIIPLSIISQKPVIDKIVFQRSFLTLQAYSGREFLKQSPIPLFQTIENNLVTSIDFIQVPPVIIECTEQEKDFKNFVGQKINYPKSYIDTVGILSDPRLDKVFLFSVYYTDLNEKFEQTSFDNKK